MINSASQAQIDAARPHVSTWVSANAGSGKTRVLTDRVARLLLNGAAPHRILCLTYTKAAAAEMQTRLFKQLGEWAMLPRQKLMDALRELGVDTAVLSEEDIRKARRLFAQALETPGGLKIQTIHAYCGALLRQFPLEAGVSPGFRELDDLGAAALREDVLEVMATEDREQVFSRLALYLGDGDLDKLISSILTHRRRYRHVASIETYEEALDEQRGLILSVLIDEAMLPLTRDNLIDYASVLAPGGATDVTISKGFRAAAETRDLMQAAKVLLTAGQTAKKSIVTTAIDKQRPDIRERLRGVADDLEEAYRRFNTSQAIERSAILSQFASAFLSRYEARKAEMGMLDFEDLIEYSSGLLGDPDYGSWVLYRLDGGLDHVLIDEAQDTSPAQWELIKSLTEAFFDGQGAAKEGRTVFVVGDKKQSIYSFQGADPRVFDTVEAHYSKSVASTSEGLVKAELLYSFRTAPPILSLVDAVYGAEHEDETVKHKAFHDARPGRVELWPLCLPAEMPEETAWYEPLDMRSPDAPAIELARNVAQFIADHLERGTVLPGTDRVVEPRDFLILVRRRNLLFQGVIKELKEAGVPIAGSDRLNVAGELAVRDLLALLRFAVSSNDDLSLAAALRSPLYGISEGQLFGLAHGRKGSLIESLGDREDMTAIYANLLSLQSNIDYTRPFELLSKILTEDGGRQRLIARLGAEAEDGIDELLSQSLIYEENEVPTISGFLEWIDNDDRDTKRQSDDARNEVRVMTVHGAKGLEAPIVILPDTGKRDPARNKDLIQVDDSGLPFWMLGAKGVQPDHLVELEAARQARAVAEDNRLLYVAMTRAERWLVVGGYGAKQGKNKVNPNEGPDSWFGKIALGLEQCGARSDVVDGGLMKVLEFDWKADTGERGEPEDVSAALPAWITHRAEAGSTVPKPLAPSDLGGVHSLYSEHTDEDLLQRGTDMHRLLEVLPDHPQEDWPAIGTALIGEAAEELMDEARQTLTAEYPVPVFDKAAMAEVPVMGQIDGFGGVGFNGYIDRLLVLEDAVWAIDYKTHRELPSAPEATPEGLKRQMGAYRALLSHIYPNKTVHVALLWTRTATLMELSHETVSQALLRASKP